MGHVEETTLGTEAAVDAVGEKSFHLSLSSVSASV